MNVVQIAVGDAAFWLRLLFARAVRIALALLFLLLPDGETQASELTMADVAAGLRATELVFSLVKGERSAAELEGVLVPSLREPETQAALDAAAASLPPLHLAMAMAFEPLANGCHARRYAARFEFMPGQVEFTVCPVGSTWLIQSLGFFGTASGNGRELVANEIAADMGLTFHPTIDCSEGDNAQVGETFACRALSESGVQVIVEIELLDIGSIALKSYRRLSEPMKEVDIDEAAAVAAEIIEGISAGRVGDIYAEASQVYRYSNSLDTLAGFSDALNIEGRALRSTEFTGLAEGQGGSPMALFNFSFDDGAAVRVGVVLIPDGGVLRLLALEIDLSPGNKGFDRFFEHLVKTRLYEVLGAVPTGLSCESPPDPARIDRLPCRARILGSGVPFWVTLDDSTGLRGGSEDVNFRLLWKLHSLRKAHGWPSADRLECSPGPEASLGEWRCVLESADRVRELQLLVSDQDVVVLDVREEGQSTPFVDLAP